MSPSFNRRISSCAKTQPDFRMFRQRKHLAVQSGSVVIDPIPMFKARIHELNLRKCDIFPAMSDYLRFFILLAAGWINRDQQKIIDYQCPLALKRSGYTRSSAKAIGSDSLISRGVGWASRRKHSDGKPSSNSLELSPQILFYAGSGPSLPENTTLSDRISAPEIPSRLSFGT